ncbi:MAG TPA: hypothetical protein VNY05_03165 [Candidatus Acidoferrales bacterium]|jgi:hypothetical protein|nr:hypothetical protein [Candidatus Acidoferrales bacterium]
MFTLPRFALAPGAPVATAPVPVALEATSHLSSGSGVGARYSVGMAWVERR